MARHFAEEGQTRPRFVAVATVLAMALCVCFFALYMELFLESSLAGPGASPSGLATGELGPVPLLRTACLLALGLAVAAAAALLPRRVAHALFRLRYAVAVVAVLAAVLLDVSGSSVGMWAQALGNGTDAGTLLGVPRGVRSDEWLVSTPFALSQGHVGYAALSSLVRGTATDMTMTYGQPAWAIPTLFRPFLWGYLVLGGSCGLAFFWAARNAALLTVTFELARVVTRDRRALSLAVALVVAFSTQVQWWFAVNSVVELLVFGQGLVLALRAYLRAASDGASAPCRWGLGALLAWMCGGYLFALYPAWQVSLFYVFAAMGVWVLVDWRRKVREGTARPVAASRLVVPVACPLLVVAALAGAALWLSRDMVAATAASVYPGTRFETGGHLGALPFSYAQSLLSAAGTPGSLWEGEATNASEQATMVTLLPLPLVLGAWRALRRRDALCRCLCVADLFLLAYGYLGFPAWLSRVTLMSNVPDYRLALALGLANVVLLARCLACADEPVANDSAAGGEGRLASRVGPSSAGARAATSRPSVGFAVLAFAAGACALAAARLVVRPSVPLVERAMLVALACAAALLLACRLVLGADVRRALLVASLLCLVPGGLFVNPVQHGVAALVESPQAQMVERVSDADPGLWAADAPVGGQLCAAVGAASLNSVNTYPDFARWHLIDPGGANEGAYNRYAHIYLALTYGPTTYAVPQGDVLRVDLNVDDLRRLGVRYFLSELDYDGVSTGSTSLARIDAAGTWSVYRVM